MKSRRPVPEPQLLLTFHPGGATTCRPICQSDAEHRLLAARLARFAALLIESPRLIEKATGLQALAEERWR